MQWAFPRLRDVVEDLPGFRPDVVHVATSSPWVSPVSKPPASSSSPRRLGPHRLRQYAGRYGVDWALRVGWHYLRWFYGQAHRVLCPSRIYEEHLHSRGVTHTGVVR